MESLKPLAIFGKSSILDVCLCSEHASQLSDMLLSRALKKQISASSGNM